ncbi:MAG: hypothetical protein IT532_13115 [Burkholderiales bacterium]|nr:hypothetical protein [Burkholderiales bacterium]
MGTRLLRISLSTLLACNGLVHAQDGGLRLQELRFESLRPGAALLDGRGGAEGREEGYDYSALSDPLGHELATGVYRPVSERLTTLLETTQSLSTGLTSEWSLLGQVGTSFGDGWGFSAGLRHSELGLQQPLAAMPAVSAGYADLGMLSLERSWNGYRGSYTYYAGRADNGGSASGHRFQLHYFYGERNSIGLSYTHGQTLGLGPHTPDESDLRNLGITGEHWFTRRWAVNYNALVEDFGDGGLKPELRLGLRLRF